MTPLSKRALVIGLSALVLMIIGTIVVFFILSRRPNLQVEIITPFKNVTIVESYFPCPAFSSGSDKSASDTDSRYWCYSWTTNDLPTKIKDNGQAMLWFRLDPPPDNTNITSIDRWSRKLAIYIQTETEIRGYSEKPEILTPNHWRVHILPDSPYGTSQSIFKR